MAIVVIVVLVRYCGDKFGNVISLPGGLGGATDNLEKSYDSLQASLTQKYGIEPVVSQGSNKAVYNLTNGTITLDADVKEQSSWHVILTYSNFASVKSSGTLGRNPIDDL